MRAWRKLYSGIITSDKLAAVSDEAKWLFVLLIVAQDDAGCYPNTETKLRSLTVGTRWSLDMSLDYLIELQQTGLLRIREDKLIEIIGGTEKNGVPSTNIARTPFYYDPPTDLSIDCLSPDKSRVDKSRVDKSRSNAHARAERDSLIDQGFEALWAIYPRKAAKQNARKAYAKLNPSEELQAQILEDIQTRCTQDGQWQDAKYIPHCATYLNGRRWDDEIKENRDGTKPEGQPREVPARQKKRYDNLPRDEHGRVKLH